MNLIDVIKNTNIKKMILSYVLVLIIPVIIGYVAYFQSAKIITNEVEKANYSILEQAKEIIDQRLLEVNAIANNLSLNPTVKELINLSQPIKNNRYYKIYKFKEELKPYIITNDFIEDFFIYFKNSKSIISPNAYYELDNFYGEFFEYSDITYKQWYDDILNKWNNNTYIGSKKVKLNGVDKNIITYLHNIPYKSSKSLEAKIIILINENKLKSLLNKIDITNGGAVFVLDDEGNIITKLSNNRANSKITKTMDIKANSLEELENNKINISSITSSFNGWKYTAILPSDIVYSKVEYIRQLTLSIFIIAILVGLVLAFVLSYNHMKPIYNIKNMLNTITNGVMQQKDKKEDYKYMQGAIHNLLINNQELNCNIKEQISILEFYVVERLLKGNFNTLEEINRALEKINLNITGKLFCVFALKIKNNYFNADVYEKNTFDKYILTNILTTNNLSGIIHNVGIDVYAILLFTEDNNKCDFHNKIQQLVKLLQAKFINYYKMKCKLGIGLIKKSIIEIPNSYNEALMAIDKAKFIVDDTNVNIYWYEVPKNNFGLLEYSVDIEIRLINLVKTGNVEEVDKLIKRIYHENFINKQLSRNLIRQLLFDIQGTILRIIGQFGLEQYYDHLKSIDYDEPIDEIYDYHINLLCEITTWFRQQKSVIKKDIINSVKKYIANNVNNANLSIYDLENKFNENESYLNQLVKESTGLTFAKYVEKIRMDNACRLLIDTNRNIQLISNDVGYNSDKTFRRAFKRILGVSPSNYRQANKLQKEQHI